MTQRRAIAAPRRIDRPVMRQHWRDLAFVHWPVDPYVIQRMLPAGVEVDTFDGSGWVGLVPFHMVGIGAGVGPGIPYLGTFPETNIRTYVTGEHGPGVWFHSLDINRLLPVLVARATYGLPYIWSEMTIDRSAGIYDYRCRRRWPGPRGTRSAVAVVPGSGIEPPDDLQVFLTARWGLYSTFRSRVTFAAVWHEPWALRRADLLHLDDQLLTAAGYPPATGEPHVMFSPGVSVDIERPRFIG